MKPQYILAYEVDIGRPMPFKLSAFFKTVGRADIVRKGIEPDIYNMPFVAGNGNAPFKGREERATISEAQYSSGLISFDNWIIIEDDLVMAKKSYLEVQANALLAEANWIQAKGGTIEYAQ